MLVSSDTAVVHATVNIGIFRHCSGSCHCKHLESSDAAVVYATVNIAWLFLRSFNFGDFISLQSLIVLHFFLVYAAFANLSCFSCSKSLLVYAAFANLSILSVSRCIVSPCSCIFPSCHCAWCAHVTVNSLKDCVGHQISGWWSLPAYVTEYPLMATVMWNCWKTSVIFIIWQLQCPAEHFACRILFLPL